MPPWGRPPGAKGSKTRKRWEREQARYRESVRVEELDSDDSSDARGVDVNGYPARYSAIDIAPKSRKAYAYQSDSSSSSDSSTDSDSSGNVSAAQVALRDKEEALVQSALARIRRAQEKGKLEVKLREDELAALENRRKRIAAENAAKAKPKSSSSSKRDKATGGSERRKKKGSGPPMVTIPIVPPPEPASSSRPHSRRHSRAIHPADPALMESYAAEYRPTSSHQHQHHASPGRPRSSSSLARPGSQHYAYPPPPMMTGRHASDGARPGSSASMAGMQMPMTVMRALLPHEEGWDPSASRRGSVGSGMEYDPFEYQVRGGPGPEVDYGRGGGGGYAAGGGGGG
ncbi:hypothetical protein V493_07988, partial [Pseudogymnoascus sp. VKM F-4281 (FW-2241)]